MYKCTRIEKELSCLYPKQETKETKDRRSYNIKTFQEIIGKSISDNHLKYGGNEERLYLHTTQSSEKVFIQFPGKESEAEKEDKRKYDFRPRIMTADGTVVKDLNFADMWMIIEKIHTQSSKVLNSLSILFFRLGRMTLHNQMEEEYNYDIIDRNNNIIKKGKQKIQWYKLHIDDIIMESLDYHVENIAIDEYSFSLEAFLYFFEFILLNEDSKYFDKKKDLSSGRIPTSDSMLLISSTLLGNIRLSVLLQRFVSGRGIAKCKADEYEVATGGLVKIVDIKKEIIDYFDERQINYSISRYVTISKNKYSVYIKTNMPKVAILSNQNPESEAALKKAGWNVFYIENLVDSQMLKKMKDIFEK